MTRDIKWRRQVVLLPHRMVLGVAIFGTEFGKGSTELSETECAFIAENYATMDANNIAEILGISAARVRGFAANRGLVGLKTKVDPRKERQLELQRRRRARAKRMAKHAIRTA